MNSMRFLITSVLVLFMQLSFGQIKKDVGTFSSIKVFNGISVELISSDKNLVEITGSQKDQVETINKNGTLHIRMALKKSFEGEAITAKVYYKHIDNIQANEGSFVSNASQIEQKLFSIEARHGSNVKLNLNVDKLNIRAVTGGTVILNGAARTMSANLGTGGILKAKELVAENADVKVSTGGQSDVNVTDLLEVTIKAGGDVNVYGNPQTIEEKITLGGTVNNRSR